MMRWLKSLFGSTGDATPVTLESLQGRWRMVSVGKNGNFAPPAMIASAKIFMIIEGNDYRVVTDGRKGDQGTIKLDTSQEPVHFDQHITHGDDAGSVHLGIARFRDGMLENFQGDKGGPRPKRFVRQWDDGASLAAFRRERAT
jgi:uncharacterized protein (TIGR03067 family)